MKKTLETSNGTSNVLYNFLHFQEIWMLIDFDYYKLLHFSFT